MTDQHRARLRELKMDRVQIVVQIAIEEALIHEGEERCRGERHHLRVRMLWIAHPRGQRMLGRVVSDACNGSGRPGEANTSGWRNSSRHRFMNSSRDVRGPVTSTLTRARNSARQSPFRLDAKEST